METKTLELTVRTENAVRDFAEKAVTRMRDQRGQTAAEYLGIVVVVAVIIGALATTDIGDKIKEFILEQVGKINGAGDN